MVRELANGDRQDSSIGHNPRRPPQRRTTGHLPREIVDQLAAAGYYAVPKESCRLFHATELVNYFDHARFGNEQGFLEHIHKRLAHIIGMTLLAEGMLQVKLSEPDDQGIIRHRVEVLVFEPRTIPLDKE